MVEQFEFELVFALPEGQHDPYDLSDAIFDAGFDDAVIGTGNPRFVAVELELEGDDAKTVILEAARAILRKLPSGSQLREIRPDLVSLADVAEKLKVKRQSLQQRQMPIPVTGGLYRIDEVLAVLRDADQIRSGGRRPRYDLDNARGWLVAGVAARHLNAMLTLREIDPVTGDIIAPASSAIPRDVTRC